MKTILYGIAIMLLGIACLLVSWMGGIPVVDIVGVIVTVCGFAVSTGGMLSKE